MTRYWVFPAVLYDSIVVAQGVVYESFGVVALLFLHRMGTLATPPVLFTDSFRLKFPPFGMFCFFCTIVYLTIVAEVMVVSGPLPRPRSKCFN